LFGVDDAVGMLVLLLLGMLVLSLLGVLVLSLLDEVQPAVRIKQSDPTIK
jgi:hypothetical protein